MSRALWIVGILVVSLTLAPVMAQAQEQGSSQPAAMEAATPAEPATAEAPADEPAAPEPAPAAPEPAPVAPPALKPITITFSGELTAAATTDAPPLIAVQDRYGVKKEISVPSEAKISKGSLSDLKVGDKLTIEYTYDVATGKRTAQSITVGEAAPATR